MISNTEKMIDIIKNDWLIVWAFYIIILIVQQNYFQICIQLNF